MSDRWQRRCGLLVLLPLLAAAPSTPAVAVRDDGVVAAMVEDAAGRMRIDPGAPALPLLTKRYAQAAGLKPGMFGLAFQIGLSTLRGRTAVARIMLDGTRMKRRVGWFDAPYAPGIDGVIGPGGLDAPIVRFELHTPRAGERSVALPMADDGGLIGNWGVVYALIDLDSERMKLRFDLHHRASLASAGAGQRIAAARGGALTGPIEQNEIVFGIVRPVRRMTLQRPLTIGPLALNELRVRVSDYGSAATIPDADAVADPDEIVVTGKKKHDVRRDQLTIGRDELDRCSSLTFDKPAKQIVLSCL